MRLAVIAAALLTAACGSGDRAGAPAAKGNAAAPAEAAATAEAGFSMRPGEWEIVTAMDMGALPAGAHVPQMPPTRVCLTPADVARGNAALLSGSGHRYGVDCDYRGVSVSAGRIRGTSTCRREGMEVSMTMDGTVSQTAYDISQQIRTTIQGRSRESAGHMTGRRIGDCAPGQNQGGRQ
jgi:hypothetical protein